MSRARRILLWLLVGAAAMLAILLIGGVLAVQSGWFQGLIKGKLVQIVEDATGGRAEIGAFQYDWKRLNASVGPFVLHGTESASEAPLFRAGKVQVGLRVISFLERQVDLKSLTVDRPQIHVVVLPDGSTNIPVPRTKRNPSSNMVEDLLNMRIREFTVRHGTAEYNGRQAPIDLQARGVEAHFFYDSTGPAYTGQLKTESLLLDSPEIRGARFAMESTVTLSRAGLQVKNARLWSGRTQLELSGRIADLASPHGTLSVKARVRAGDVNRRFGIPLGDNGEANFTGDASFHSSPAFGWELKGKVAAAGLDYRDRYVALRNVGLNSSLRLTPDKLELPDLALSALDGTFRGRLELAQWSKLKFDGEAHALLLQSAASPALPQDAALSARVSGPVRFDGRLSGHGLRDAQAGAKLTLEPVPGGLAVQGFVDAAYDQQAGMLSLGASTIDVGASHLEVSGVWGQTLNVHAATRDPQELLAALPLGEQAPRDLPLKFMGGMGRFNGAVSGPLDRPQIAGQIELTQFSVQGQGFDRLTCDFELRSNGLNAHSFTISQGATQLSGKGRLGLLDWKAVDGSPISGSADLRGAGLKRILEQQGSQQPVAGTLSAQAVLKGTFGAPEALGSIDVVNATAYEEHASLAKASFTVSGDRVQVSDLRLEAGTARLQGSGSYERTAKDWTSGVLRFDLTARQVSLAQIHLVHQAQKDLAGVVDGTARGSLRLSPGEFRVESLTSETRIRDVGLAGRRYGNFTLSANSRGPVLDLQATADLLGTPIHGSGEWSLEGDNPGHGRIAIPRLTMAALHGLLPNPARAQMPFDGYVEGKVDIAGPLRKPDLMKAVVEIGALQINASAGARPRAGAQPRDLVLRNVRPIVLDATTKGVQIRSAQLTGTETTLDAQGKFSFDSKSPWDLRLKGTVNLSILQIFNPDLLGSGGAVVDAAIRGPLVEPQVDGRMELKNASLYVTDLPNGLDKANGVVVFDRNRATVESLTATTGGGNVAIQRGSFVGFRGAALQYRLQATADRVRYRSPEGISITVNALLNLIGTSESSVLSGVVTVVRTGFNPTTDVGNLLASTAKPVSAPPPNAYLKGIQFDVRVEGAQSLEIQTSLTRNIQAEANLRVRGTPERPVVLGRLNVNEGEIEFFGNKYRINRATVNFYNTAKIEPIIDMDLETEVRGITVDITFSGPLSKLNFSYRSDPPLETNDIIGLLAVGRTPTAIGASAGSQTESGPSYVAGGANALLSQAISAPAAGRLQRFFGVSHIKIDPQLTDVTSVPQARLTLEQQITKDITFTYITNLTRTQEQIVRAEWNLNPHWSVIALRDENGAFSIDFQYRRRFK